MSEVSYLEVSPSEAGSKLLSFLERRLDLPVTLLFKWIRTGQVRVNGQRSGPYRLLAQGALVRVPPFRPAPESPASGTNPPAELSAFGIEPVFEDDDLLVLNKPAGLACHGGSGQSGHLAAILRDLNPGPFPISAAHRLDQDTSGLILAAKSLSCLKKLHEQFRAGLIRKTYLAWAPGLWPHERTTTLEHHLARQTTLKDGRPFERMLPVDDCSGALARSEVSLVRQAGGASLLAVRPLTGRRHQIRAQLSACGFPIVGDRKYGGPAGPGLLLHALALTLPDQRSWLAWPAWPPPWEAGPGIDVVP